MSRPLPAQVALLVEDPDLAIGIPDDDHERAQRALVVPMIEAEAGPLDLPSMLREPTLGVVVISGYVRVSILLRDRTATQLAGPGDVLHASTGLDSMVPAALSYDVAERVRLAVLDARFIAGVRRWPSLLIALHERLRVQAHRLAIHAAIGKLRRVEDRVLAVLWQIGEQWGRMTADGVVISMPLTHEIIGRIAGAERSTVSLALAALAADGALVRRNDGAFILAPDSWTQLRPISAAGAATERRIHPPRSRRDIDRDALRRRIAALGAEFDGRVKSVDEVLATSRALSARSRETRRQLPEARGTDAPLPH